MLSHEQSDFFLVKIVTIVQSNHFVNFDFFFAKTGTAGAYYYNNKKKTVFFCFRQLQRILPVSPFDTSDAEIAETVVYIYMYV